VNNERRKQREKLLWEDKKKKGSKSRGAPTKLDVLQESLPKEIQGMVYEDEGDLWEYR
jgi:hypothetical protein